MDLGFTPLTPKVAFWKTMLVWFATSADKGKMPRWIANISAWAQDKMMQYAETTQTIESGTGANKQLKQPR